MLNSVEKKIIQIETIISECISQGRLSSIERDLMLSKLRDVYDDLMFIDTYNSEDPNNTVYFEDDSIMVDLKPQSNKYFDFSEPLIENGLNSDLEPFLDESYSDEQEPEIDVFEEEKHLLNEGDLDVDNHNNDSIALEDEDLVEESDLETVEQERPLEGIERFLDDHTRSLLKDEMFDGDRHRYDAVIRELNAFDDFDLAIIYLQERLWRYNHDSELLSKLVDVIDKNISEKS